MVGINKLVHRTFSITLALTLNENKNLACKKKPTYINKDCSDHDILLYKIVSLFLTKPKDFNNYSILMKHDKG